MDKQARLTPSAVSTNITPRAYSCLTTFLGQYKLYAVNLPSLTDVPGWPYILPNKPANNDLSRYFIAGTVLQRSALSQVGNSLVVAFGGHCDNFNYTYVPELLRLLTLRCEQC